MEKMPDSHCYGHWTLPCSNGRFGPRSDAGAKKPGKQRIVSPVMATSLSRVTVIGHEYCILALVSMALVSLIQRWWKPFLPYFVMISTVVPAVQLPFSPDFLVIL
jgi:hypothetical protein